MIEEKALAYVNMYGVLGSLENLCELDAEARAVLAEFEEPAALCFAVAGGPTCTFTFSADGCTMSEGSDGATMKMAFASPKLFNKLIESSIPGVAVKHPAATLKFLMGPFSRLTDRLNDVLRPTPEALQDRAFYEENTLMTLYVIAGAVSALANYDSISRISAGNTVDGQIEMSIADAAAITIEVKDHVFTTKKAPADNPRATMQFADIELAHDLFEGTASALNEMCKGRIVMAGMVSMVDNVNRILDRVSDYLA